MHKRLTGGMLPTKTAVHSCGEVFNLRPRLAISTVIVTFNCGQQNIHLLFSVFVALVILLIIEALVFITAALDRFGLILKLAFTVTFTAKRKKIEEIKK